MKITGAPSSSPVRAIDGVYAQAQPAVIARAPAPARDDQNVSLALARILRPQAAYRWMLPQVAAITPQYIEAILRGALAGDHVRQWELFDLMLDTWPELAACSQELTLGVSRLKMIVEPFAEEDEDPTPNALERAKLVSSALRRMRPDAAADDNNVKGTMRDICDGWFRGVTTLEINWQTIDSPKLGTFVAPQSTFWVHPVCFAFGQDGRLGLRTDAKGQISPANLGGMSYQPAPSSVGEFPEHKFLIAIHKAKSGTALGSALLRPLAWWWCAANFSADWLLNLAQIFGLPFRWANYDPTAPQETVDRICSMLQNMGSAGWAAFPAGTTMEMKEAGKGGDHSPQGELLDRADRYARLLILGQTQSGGKGSAVGGQAFGTVEASVKADRIEAAGGFTCEVLNDQLIPAILRLNYGDDEEAPSVRLLEDEEGGLEEAQRDQILAQIMPLSAKYLRSKYGQPKPVDEEDAVGGAPVAEEGETGRPGDKGTDRKPAKSSDRAVKAHCARLAAIPDDAVFARELQIVLDEIAASESYDPGEARDEHGRWTDADGYFVSVSADLKTISYGKDKLKVAPLGVKNEPLSKTASDALKKSGKDPSNYINHSGNPKNSRDFNINYIRKGAQPLLESAQALRKEGRPNWIAQGAGHVTTFTQQGVGRNGGSLSGVAMIAEVPEKGWTFGAKDVGGSFSEGFFKDKANAPFVTSRAEAEKEAIAAAHLIGNQSYALHAHLHSEARGWAADGPAPTKGDFRWAL